MKNTMKAVFMVVFLLAFVSMGLAEKQELNFKNISNTKGLLRVLTDRFDTYDTDIANLQSSGNLGTGNVFYVDSGKSNAATVDGKTPTEALPTLDAAVAKCTANNGDIIYVMQGHTEDLSGADGVDLDVAGITVIGLGKGTDKPEFVYTNAAGEFVIGAANVTISNLRFVPSVTGIAHAIDVENAGDFATIVNCEFADGEAAATDEFLDGIAVGTTATDCTIANCTYYCTGAPANFINLEAATIVNPTCYGNIIYGTFSEAGIWAGTAVPTNCYIGFNTVTNLSTGQYAIEFGGAATGVCEKNSMYTDTIATTLDPGSMSCIENYGINTVDLSAIRIPALPAIGTVTAGSADDILKKMYYGSDGTGAYPATLVNDSALAMIMCNGATATPSTFNNTTMSLQALNVDLDSLLHDAVDIDANLVVINADTDAIQHDLVDVDANIISIQHDLVDVDSNIAVIQEDLSDFDANLTAVLVDTAAMDTASEMQALTGTGTMEKSISKTVSTIANGANNLFAVTGGPIKITEIVAYVTTTAIASESCTISYNIDPTTPATDTAFGITAPGLEINADAVGTLYTWDGVLATDLTEVTNGVALAMGTDVSYGLIVPIGMVELTAVHDGTCAGELTVYMRYIPLSASSVVTAQ
ncbi:MAG: hypothetical protein WC356_02745 [Candidatus Micrarchaeia archaeon]|jgi:hypothetical protein